MVPISLVPFVVFFLFSKSSGREKKRVFFFKAPDSKKNSQKKVFAPRFVKMFFFLQSHISHHLEN